MYYEKTIFKSWLIILFCSFLLMVGCSALQDLAQSIKKPKLSVTDVHVTDYDFKGINLAFDVTVENPNALSIQMMSFDYNFGINGQSFVNGEQDKETRIEASGSSTFQVPVRLGFKEVYSTVKSLVNSNKAAYTFKSKVVFNLPGLGRTEVPVSKEGEIPLLQIPSVRINNLLVDELNFNGASLILDMELDNPNSIGFTIKDFDYSLNINGSRWAEGSALENITISENGITKLAIPIKLNIAQLGTSVLQLLSGSQEVTYELDGNFLLDATHPLLGKTNFKIDRQGRLSLGGN